MQFIMNTVQVQNRPVKDKNIFNLIYKKSFCFLKIRDSIFMRVGCSTVRQNWFRLAGIKPLWKSIDDYVPKNREILVCGGTVYYYIENKEETIEETWKNDEVKLVHWVVEKLGNGKKTGYWKTTDDDTYILEPKYWTDLPPLPEDI